MGRPQRARHNQQSAGAEQDLFTTLFLCSSVESLSSEIVVVTTPAIPGYRIVRVVGPVYGMTIRSRGVGGRFVAGI